MGLNIKKILQIAVGGGGPSTPKKPLYLRLIYMEDIIILVVVDDLPVFGATSDIVRLDATCYCRKEIWSGFRTQ